MSFVATNFFMIATTVAHSASPRATSATCFRPIGPQFVPGPAGGGGVGDGVAVGAELGGTFAVVVTGSPGGGATGVQANVPKMIMTSAAATPAVRRDPFQMSMIAAGYRSGWITCCHDQRSSRDPVQQGR
ncbi:hypothetical protein GCM10028864_51140 [Microlunatus parietis]